ncbi:diguanylate cyclase (GGDEF) domain-containing protein [Paracidovorax valerianellae]|uniref:Diguanylate cyclase (GGDEF) domain-containing protein n=1 Tax=Paracidovorax valerianellae TaxID=187868 RepID=A0A1G6ZPJ9_9BURK|nr:EAL domain-containing protein [Paracidovorax valerianellae]SDE04451.1 diguanylate cyclase (GGDEF) domain-containing protein [Paracidovorax valerianellae]
MNLRALRRSLILRLVGISLLLLLIVQAAGFVVVQTFIVRNARAQIERSLDVDERVWRWLLDQNAVRLKEASTLLASDYGFRSAVNSGDADTIQSVLENHGARIGAAMTALLDPRMQLQAASPSRTAAEYQSAVDQAVPALVAQPQGSQIAVVNGIPYQFVMVPLRAPLLIGWVLMGFPVNETLVSEMQQLLSVDVAIQIRDAAGAVSVPVSSLPPRAFADLRDFRMGGEREIGGETLLVRAVRLDSGATSARALLLRSLDDVVEPYRQLQILLGVITVVGLVLFALGSAFMARRVTMPLRSLVDATHRLSQGDYGAPIEHTTRHDEIGNLARSFDRMRLDIAGQQDQIRRLADIDRLTGVPNRERFRSALMDAIGPGGGGRPVAVIALDLDRFKHVNGVLGYALGDRLLQAVAERLGMQARSSQDMIARLGGNQFAMMLPGGDATSAREMAQRIIRAFEMPVAFGDQTVDLSAGMGIACWPGTAQDADTLLSHAEIAMYAAKQRLSGALVYEPSMDSSSAGSLSLLTELRRAVDRNELRLFLQPKVTLTGQPGNAAEALVRWQHPERGMVPPLQFIPFAEQTGFVRQLTLWMFEQAVVFLAQPQVRAMSLQISINLSTRDLLDPELSNRFGALLERHGVSASAFCLEITESAIMDEPLRAEAMLNRLSEQGFKLSIDDFGTGYSSLAYLKRLPVDELKIDKSFVIGMAADDGDEQIVRSTIDLAHNLGLSVVAEGVETVAILERLRALHCDDAQGYYISRPLPMDDFLAWHAAAAEGK